MRRVFARFFLILAVPAFAHAHFVFVVPQQSGAAASVFISETLEPDPAVDLELVKGTQLRLWDSTGRDMPLQLSKSGSVYTVPVTGTGTRVLHGVTDIGISGSADKLYLLLYYPKTILGDAFDPKATIGASLPVEIVPQGKPGALTLKLVARGKPQAGAEIVVLLPDGKQKKVTTDRDGNTEMFSQAGRYGAWARFWETSASGERNGKKYAETHHYATLVFETAPATSSAVPSALPFATLPQAAASFGAIASDGWLYVYGGHISPTHSYFIEAVSGRFDRLRLTGEPVWEQLPEGPRLQGMNLAAYKGLIYRVGGMVPLNKRGEPADNHSVADVARFDPHTNKWESLAPMPEPRSSHDVAVIGNELYVIGGWNMTGKSQTWADTMLVMDLSATPPSWTTLPQPFKRRALMAASFDEKLYVIGGIDDAGVIERTVSIYDPKTKTWSDGPQLPQGPTLGFAPATIVHEGSLYVSISDGSLLRLNQARTAWEKAGLSTPRVAHRLAPRGDTILVIGGAANGKNYDLIEAVGVGQK